MIGNMILSMKITLLYTMLLSLSLPRGVQAESVVIIVNEKSDISLGDLNKIYRGRMAKWGSGNGIIVANRDALSMVRKGFYLKVLKSKPTQNFFLHRSPIPFRPIIQKSALGTIKFVASYKNSIGYIYFSELRGDELGIKILKVDGLTH